MISFNQQMSHYSRLAAILILVGVNLLGLGACQTDLPPSATPSQLWPQVERYFSSGIGWDIHRLREYALLPDGSAVYDIYQTQIDLVSGTKARPLAGNGIPSLTSVIYLSPDGRYLSGIVRQVDRTSGEPILEDVLVDLQAKTFRQYTVGGGIPAISWSPHSSRFLVSDNRTLVSVPGLQATTA